MHASPNSTKRVSKRFRICGLSHRISHMKTCFHLIRLAALVGFVSCCGAYLAAQGNLGRDQQQKVKIADDALQKAATPEQIKAAVEQQLLVEAESSMDCLAGCPVTQGRNCMICHNSFTARTEEDCEDCAVIGFTRKANQQWIGVRGFLTGKPIKVVADWRRIGLPANHLTEAKRLRAASVPCKKTATQ